MPCCCIGGSEVAADVESGCVAETVGGEVMDRLSVISQTVDRLSASNQNVDRELLQATAQAVTQQQYIHATHSDVTESG